MARSRPLLSSGLVLALWLLRVPGALAQPAPVPPALVTQDEAGHVTLRATRVTGPMRVDGLLDDAVYSQVPPITGLIQIQPRDGEPASEKTEVWILFDDDNLYVTCRCGHRNPKEIVIDDMRRDVNQGDFFSISFDTFHDLRNSYLFYMSPIGAMTDVLTTDERNRNDSWNGVWDVKSSRFDGGWIGEMVIPFKTLRYHPGRDQTWGVVLRRRIRHNGDEHDFLPRMPKVWGPTANMHMSAAATLVGLEAPPPALNLEIKPYGIAGLRTDLQASPAFTNDPNKDVGVDVKYGITKSLTLDGTVNTDFAQVEADQAQVNLTRFSLFFPEKREFFLEGQGLFAFGGGSGTTVVPVMFFSRRIGLQAGRPVPIIAGARLTGQSGRYAIGALSITTDKDAAHNVQQTTFNVLRVKRNVLRRSSVGMLMTHRSTALTGDGSNMLYGVDALFSFYQNLNISGYAAKTDTRGAHGHDWSYRTQFDYAGDRYGLQLERLAVGDNFNPEVGFLQREDFRRTYGLARFSPRPAGDRGIRKLNYEGSIDYFTDNRNTLQSRDVQETFRVEFRSSNVLTVDVDESYERVERAFSVGKARIAPGGYTFKNLRGIYTVGQQQRVSGTATAERGGYYGGDKTSLSYKGRVKFGIHLAIEPTVTIDWIDLPATSEVSKVVSTRATYSLSPRMFVAALVQYSSTSTSLSTNLRMRWEYQPGSELFVVYTEGRDTAPPGRTALENRGLAVKVTKLFRF